MSGKLFIFSGPSGSGKTTIVQHLLRTVPGMTFSVSVTSRQRRRDEVEGRDYYFVTPAGFRKKIEDNEFIEWEEVYSGQFYGTLRSEVERLNNLGKHVLFDVDVMGGLNLKDQFDDRALSVFVKPPSLRILEERLRLRCTEDEDSFSRRVGKAIQEMDYSDRFDAVLINDNLTETLTKAHVVVDNFINRK